MSEQIDPSASSLCIGDCRDLLARLPEGCVQTCVTSPPYWGLRDYGTDVQIGKEATPGEYVAALVDVFRGVRRALRDDGTLWLNLVLDPFLGSGTTAMVADQHRRRWVGFEANPAYAALVEERLARPKLALKGCA